MFAKSNKPVVFEYNNPDAKTITSAILKNGLNQILTQVEPLDCGKCCDITIWSAIFDPMYFNDSTTYSITWIGTDLNDAPLEDVEGGITITYTQDFYSGFLKTLRQSMLDDGETCDYPIDQLLNAVEYANCLINNTPPFSTCGADDQPCAVLLDLAKVQLYKSRAGKEAMETFTYNDIGKSFSFDISGKLLQLAESLERNALEMLKLIKRNMRPGLRGLSSRYSRRSSSSVRTMHIQRIQFRDFIR